MHEEEFSEVCDKSRTGIMAVSDFLLLEASVVAGTAGALVVAGG